MAGKVLNIKVCSPLKQRSGLTGKYHAICHYSYNLPLAYIAKLGVGGKLRVVGLALRCREYRHRPLELSQILLPIPPSPYGQSSHRSGGRRVPKQRLVVARTETAGGMANKICGTSNLPLYERFGLVGKSRPCRGYAPAAPPTPVTALAGKTNSGSNPAQRAPHSVATAGRVAKAKF